VTPSTGLRRSLGFWALVAFGVGDILGAGIYALVGKVAAVAGAACWVAFAVSMGVAAFTALSYAELGGRFPKSAGEAQFSREGFRAEWLAWLIGWLVLCSGIVSMAAVSRAFAGYLIGWLPQLSASGVIVAFLLALTAINCWGMRQSSTANIVCTVIELSGLLIVVIAGLMFLGGGRAAAAPAVPAEPVAWSGILQGGALAFFAFIGFEDMVNVAEEVHTPERTLPRAILCAVSFAGVLYLVVAWIAVSVLGSAELSASSAPLLDVVRRAAPAIPDGLFTIIALFAVTNTALLNFIMGSRLVYGMAAQGLAPRWLSAIHPARHTPHRAILAVVAIALTLALSGTIVVLAGTTSVLLLAVFAVVNLALVVIKHRSVGPPAGAFRVPWLVPVIGVCTSLGLMAFVPPHAVRVALVIAGLGLVLFVLKPRSVS